MNGLRGKRDPVVAIVGATGAVGREFLALFEERALEHGELRLLASARSAGGEIAYRGRAHTVRALSREALEGVDLALFSAGGAVSKEYAPIASEMGAVVVDNSSAFRMDPGVALVVPEVNGALLDGIGEGGAIIANPNCSTIILMLALHPLRERFGIERAIVSTYQAASGAGAAAMEELRSQTRTVLDGGAPEPKVFPEVCAFNVFSHNSKVDEATGRNVEEQKMIDEVRKIWGDDSVRISATCIRVPTLRAHCESVHVMLGNAAGVDEVRRVLADAPGVELVDDRAGNRFPTSLRASGKDAVLVGRVRVAGDAATDGAGWARSFELFIAGDQIRKGAALNAIQIGERLLGRA
ncbi:MAG: aspartate-semialdehyde dehydrogenase [Phycisphaeraceae bacterium]|nr:MAG: aspartate-semialdehyde dehydrogenase [Phycisphaeraceae bacterium]